MRSGNNYFYFLSDDYYDKFNTDGKLMTNKGSNLRPCFYAFKERDSELYWMIPISSKVEKYRGIYEKKVAKSKNGTCDTIDFGYVWGEERAFLIQNMCPATANYFVNHYVKHETIVTVDVDFERELLKKAKRILRHVRAGRTYLILPNVLRIERELLEELAEIE